MSHFIDINLWYCCFEDRVEDVEVIADSEDADDQALARTVQFKVFGKSPSKEDVKRTVSKLRELITKREAFRQTGRNTNHETEAQNLLDLLKGPTFWSDSSASSSPMKKHTFDPLYCPDSNTPSRSTPFSITAMRNILKLVTQGRSEAGIRKLYPKYRRQYKDHFKRCLDQGLTRTTMKQLINNFALERFTQARENNYPIRGYTIRDWATQEALRRIVFHRFRNVAKEFQA